MAIKQKRTFILDRPAPHESVGSPELTLTVTGVLEDSRVDVSLNDGYGNRADTAFTIGELRELVSHLQAAGIDLTGWNWPDVPSGRLEKGDRDKKAVRDGCNCGDSFCGDCRP